MDKRVVNVMYRHGRSLAFIAGKFKVSTSRIYQITKSVKEARKEELEGKTPCDVCQKPVVKTHTVEIEGVEPLIVCGKCKKKLP